MQDTQLKMMPRAADSHINHNPMARQLPVFITEEAVQVEPIP